MSDRARGAPVSMPWLGVLAGGMALTVIILSMAPAPIMAISLILLLQATVAASLWALHRNSTNASHTRTGADLTVDEGELRALHATLEAVKTGDLTARVRGSDGTLGNLGQALDEALESLGAVITQLATRIVEIGTAAEALERNNRTNAERSSHQTTTIAEVARKLKTLGARSEEVGQIVELLEDVAAQTNILALNAAIEASRAGAQGKGFGMVADEVRKLAERSAAATKDVGAFIQSLQGTADDTAESVERIKGLTDALVTGASDAARASAALLASTRAVSKELLGLRVPGQEDPILTRALREHRIEIARALDPVAPLLDSANSPLGTAVRHLLIALGDGRATGGDGPSRGGPIPHGPKTAELPAMTPDAIAARRRTRES